MFRVIKKVAAAAFLTVGSCLAAGAALAAEPIPVADFFRLPVMSDPVMSPSGQYVAALMKGGPKGRLVLVLLNLQDPSKSQVLAAYADADIRAVQWVNDDRLVFALTDAQSAGGDQISRGFYAVARDGKGPVRTLRHSFHSVLRDGSNDVIIAEGEINDRYEVTRVSLLRLDTVTGRSRVLTLGGPDHARSWALDRQGEPRAAVTSFEGKSRLYWKARAEAPWTMIWERPAFGDHSDTTPLMVDDSNRLYVAARRGDDDTQSLMRVDMSRKDAEMQSLISLPGYDFDGALLLGPKSELLAAGYLTDARGTHWFDPALKEIQQRVDKLLAGTVNQIDCGECRNPGTVLITSWSDRQPAIFRLYDTKSGAHSLLGQTRPWIKPQTMATRQMQRFTARDGMSIPIHVTRPAGREGPAPTVVLVHGGPYMRGGEWEWNAESQFLASRGYAVVEPEFRGSTGFGYKLFRAGFKQWGLAMQDDIADATEWAVKQGFTDPKRICIAGASYGGYAALMGLIRYPQLYRCGINAVGVTDLDLMYTSRWSDFSEMWKEYGMPVLMGDREKDAKQLAATSPVKLAHRLTQPLLMAYGGEDRRVPIAHGGNLRAAVAPHNKNLEWVEYPDEGHGWMLEANKVDFWTRVERFLDRHLKAVP